MPTPSTLDTNDRVLGTTTPFVRYAALLRRQNPGAGWNPSRPRRVQRPPKDSGLQASRELGIWAKLSQAEHILQRWPRCSFWELGLSKAKHVLQRWPRCSFWELGLSKAEHILQRWPRCSFWELGLRKAEHIYCREAHFSRQPEQMCVQRQFSYIYIHIKLYDSKEKLEKSATFILQTALSVQQ